MWVKIRNRCVPKHTGGDGIHVEGALDVAIDSNSMNNIVGKAINILDGSTIDEETKKLILELQAALNNRDASLAKKIFSALADKSIDLVIALTAGQVLK